MMIWLGIVLFFGIHIMPSIPGVREQLISRVGAGPYKGLFALVSLGGLVLMGFGYVDMEYQELWQTPVWAAHLALAVMPVAFILWVAAEMKGRIRLKVKHPMMIGMLLWSLVHLANNGDEASLYLFGTFALYSVFSIVSSTRRGKLPDYPEPQGKFDIIAVIVGLSFFGGMLWAHEFLIGVSPGI
jgi:uncharacterized membrane protein